MDAKMDKLGIVIKAARLHAGLTRKELAAKLYISQRHLMSIENCGQKPSYDLLFYLIRTLSVPADLIFYPEYIGSNEKYEQAVILLKKCNDRNLGVIIATLRSLLTDE